MIKYSMIEESIKDYVTETHCDDMVLNSLAANTSGKPPLRIQLPKSSVIDYFALCYRLNTQSTGGISQKSGWWENRANCAFKIEKEFGFPLIVTDEVGVCTTDGLSLLPQCRVNFRRWQEMFSAESCSDITSIH